MGWERGKNVAPATLIMLAGMLPVRPGVDPTEALIQYGHERTAPALSRIGFLDRNL